MLDYLKSKFTNHQYNQKKQLIKTQIQKNVNLDEIYKSIKSSQLDFDKIMFDSEPINKDEELFAYRTIISEPNFAATNIHFDVLKKLFEKNLDSKNLSKRDYCEIQYTIVCHQLFMDNKNDNFQDFKEKHRKRLILYFLVVKYGWVSGLKIFKNLKKLNLIKFYEPLNCFFFSIFHKLQKSSFNLNMLPKEIFIAKQIKPI